LVGHISFHIQPPVPDEDNWNAPFNPLFYAEKNFAYPSDGLSLRELRLLWPEADDMGKVVGRVRFLEHHLVEGVAVDIDQGRGEGRPGSISDKGLRQQYLDNCQELKEFYVTTGLASGDHAAELLIRDMEERARRQYRPRFLG
jgi:hypothetical protein